MAKSRRVPAKDRIRASTEKLSGPIRKKWLNQCEDRNTVESRRVPAKDGIRASTKKLSGPVRKNGRISVSTEILFNPGEYGQKMEFVRVPKNYPNQYEKMVEYV